MKLMCYRHAGRPALGAVMGDRVVDVSAAAPDLATALDPAGIEAARRLADSAAITHALTDVEPLMPIAAGARIFCVGLNYAGHIREMGYEMPEFPAIFMRTHASLAAHGADIVKPSVSDQYDYECELTAVIGRAARYVPEAVALDHVAGYTIMNEGSVRDWQRRGPQVTPGKNFDRSGALGPWIATAEDIPDPARLTLETRVDGEVRQRSPTDDMVFSVPYLISYISTFCELQPGDLISTGSPSGSAAGFDPPRWLAPADVVEMEVPEIGVLRNRVAAE